MHVDSLFARAAALVRLAAAGAIVALCIPAAANDVLKWNDTTVKAATTGGQNPIQQTRTVAMVQGAVHDALNAIKPRYAAYYYEGTAAAGALPEAAVAAASRTVLVAVIPSFGQPPQRTDALALVEEAYRAALAGISRQSRKGKWHRGRAGGRRSDAGVAQGRWRDARCTLHAGERARSLATAPEPRSAQSADQGSEGCARHGGLHLARVGQRHPLHAAVGIAVLVARATGIDECAVRKGLQRGEVHRRPGEHRSHARAERDCALLV